MFADQNKAVADQEFVVIEAIIDAGFTDLTNYEGALLEVQAEQAFHAMMQAALQKAA